MEYRSTELASSQQWLRFPPKGKASGELIRLLYRMGHIMNGGMNADGTAWLSPDGARFLAEQYYLNKWSDYEIVEEEYDKNTIEAFFFHIAELQKNGIRYGT